MQQLLMARASSVHVVLIDFALFSAALIEARYAKSINVGVFSAPEVAQLHDAAPRACDRAYLAS